MALDYAIRLGINSLGEETFADALAKTSVLDAGWNAATLLINNPRMAATLDCVRSMARDYVQNNNFGSAIEACVRSVIATAVSYGLFRNTGRYANLLREQFERQPRRTISRLKSYGITKDSMLDLTRMLFASAVLELEILIREAYEE